MAARGMIEGMAAVTKRKRTSAATRTGRPSKIDVVVSRRDVRDPKSGDVVEQVDVTAGDAIVERVRQGAYREEAAKSVGVAKRTLYDWLYAGALARTEQLQGARLNAEAKRYVEFLHSVERAEAEAMLLDWTRLSSLGAGGQLVEVVTEKVDGDGKLIERTTRRSYTQPDASVLQWRLERRWPKLFGRQVALTGPDGGPIELDVDDTRARARALSDEITAYMQGVADGTIEPVVEK